MVCGHCVHRHWAGPTRLVLCDFGGAFSEPDQYFTAAGSCTSRVCGCSRHTGANHIAPDSCWSGHCAIGQNFDCPAATLLRGECWSLFHNDPASLGPWGASPPSLANSCQFIHCYPCELLPIIGTLSRLLYNISMKSTEFVTLTSSSRTSVSPTIQGLCLIFSTCSNPSRAFSLCTDERGWSNHHSNVEATVPPSRG